MQFMKVIKSNSKLLITSLLLLCSLKVKAQSATETSRYTLPFQPNLVSIDRQGYLYIANSEGTIHKLNKEGEIQSTFSPQKRGEPSFLETWQGLRVFVYYRNFQEYLLLNRFLSNENRINTALEDFSSITGLATLSNDNNLWLFNDRDLILTKRDINNQEILFEAQLNLGTDFSSMEAYFMRAYQSYLFISTNNGILLFDNLGNYLSKIVNEPVQFFGFRNDELVYSMNNTLSFVSIEGQSKREILLPDSPRFVLTENNQVFAFKGKNLIVYEIN